MNCFVKNTCCRTQSCFIMNNYSGQTHLNTHIAQIFMLPNERGIIYKYNVILLTVTDIIPVNVRKERMAAQSLITQPFLLPTQQALDQIKKFTTNLHILWELQKSLH